MPEFVPARSREAVDAAKNALTTFVCRHFPPPELVEITVTRADRARIAMLHLNFTINYGDGVIV